MTPGPDDDCESTTQDLISMIYGLQCILKTLTEMLAMDRNNPISPKSWHFLACAKHYLRKDVSSHVH